MAAVAPSSAWYPHVSIKNSFIHFEEDGDREVAAAKLSRSQSEPLSLQSGGGALSFAGPAIHEAVQAFADDTNCSRHDTPSSLIPNPSESTQSLSSDSCGYPSRGGSKVSVWSAMKEEAIQPFEQDLSSDTRLQHIQGTCNPCSYFAFKSDGCLKGAACEFCHLCTHEEAQARRKQIKSQTRARKRLETTHRAGVPKRKTNGRWTNS
eukprot:gb/GFBE01018058.1/.p1 GENE.gb/GFBE01018058.1/~~gb/GFBE01018058.1/.p1  ORF type:complete len:207 (+),score=21.65 gb/GFBE01018058.1/:1-621(+)